MGSGRGILDKNEELGKTQKVSQVVLKILDFGLRAIGVISLTKGLGSCVLYCVCVEYLNINPQVWHFYIDFEKGRYVDFPFQNIKFPNTISYIVHYLLKILFFFYRE